MVAWVYLFSHQLKPRDLNILPLATQLSGKPELEAIFSDFGTLSWLHSRQVGVQGLEMNRALQRKALRKELIPVHIAEHIW